jgi:hypothetical protein
MCKDAAVAGTSWCESHGDLVWGRRKPTEKEKEDVKNLTESKSPSTKTKSPAWVLFKKCIRDIFCFFLFPAPRATS